MTQTKRILETVLEHTHMMAVYLDPQFNFIWVNRAYAKTCGHEPSYFPGKNHFDLYPHEENRVIFQKVVETGIPCVVEAKAFEFPDQPQRGVTYWDWSLSPVKEAGKGVLGLVFTLEEVTQRVRAERELRRSEDRFRLLVESAPAFIMLLQKGQYIFGNPASARMLGYEKPEELIGVKALDTIAPEFRDLVANRMKQIETGRHNSPVEVQFLRQDKTRVWTLTTSVHTQIDGVPTAIVVGQDNSERMEIEQNLLRARNQAQESEEKYRALIENSLEGVVILDLDGTILFANRAVLNALEISDPDQVVGRKVFEFIAPDSLEKVGQDFVNVLNGKDSYVSEYRCLTPAKKEFWLESIGKMIHYTGKSAILISLRNVTLRKKDEAERELMQAQLNQSRKMESIGRLAGGVAHDFNNMLGVIIGYADMSLQTISSDHPLHANILEISKAAERSATLTRQLLGFARRQTIAPRVLDLNQTVKGMRDMLQRLIGEEISLVWKPGENLDRVMIDPSQVDQILANLCVNARDAIEGSGTITVESENAAFDETFCRERPGFVPGHFVGLSVRDTGRGMDQETMDSIFEPFFTTKQLGRGTGLGLATVYGIVKQNKGFINVESAPGRGTCFRIFFPRQIDTGEVDSPAAAVETIRDGTGTILLVEDEPSILSMCALMLEGVGYRVLSAATPVEALNIAETYSGQIDLLMTDLIMPEMNGRQLADIMLKRYPKLKRMFMSGYSADVIAHHGVLDPGVHFISKPFSLRELSEKIQEVLG